MNRPTHAPGARTPRRPLLVAAAVGLCLVSGIVKAQSWPERPVTLVVPFPPGGTTDVLARALAGAEHSSCPIRSPRRTGSRGEHRSHWDLLCFRAPTRTTLRS
jgi:hypothetical protein